MRRKHSEITDPREIQRILSSTNIGRLATNGRDGYPYITPVNFVSLEGNIYFHCAPKGEKLDNIARDPRVCFEVDVPLAYLNVGIDPNSPICHLHQFYHCVIIRGTASVVRDSALKVAALNALVAKHETTANFEPVSEDMPAYKACKLIEIKPLSITAKSDLAQNKSEEARRAIAEYLANRGRPGDRETVEAMDFQFK
ncbi:MAG: pyridoxamine 5'-phosphate oxidase family protein [Desulfobacteraceae bacterium]|nr:pyridoxamine 5'-phosphate oxidase family protein [Desulfobacteraceae bacterium]